jgi:hypothetical protein
MASEGNNQGSLDLQAFWPRKPKDAPARLVRMIESDAQAVAVAIKSSGLKLAYIAASLNKSESYISRIRSGQRPMPDKLVAPFCRVVGTRLLAQYRELCTALESTPRSEIERLAGMLREAA